MTPTWDYFWPVFTAAFAIGSLGGTIGFRKHKLSKALIAGIALTLVFTAVWHWPLGAANRFSTQVERSARVTLDAWEMTKIKAHLHHDPLTRTLVLSGPADDFQSSELVRIMESLPGIGSARWNDRNPGVPLVGEAGVVSIVGFLLGLLLAYLVELRRRYNAQWNW